MRPTIELRLSLMAYRVVKAHVHTPCLPQANPSDMAANQDTFIILKIHFSPFALLFIPLTLGLVCIRLVLGLEVEGRVDRTEEHLTVNMLAFADH